MPYSGLIFEIKHKINKSDEIEFLSPYQFEPIKIKINEMFDERNGKALDTISSGYLGQAVVIPVSDDVKSLLPPLSVARKYIRE